MDAESSLKNFYQQIADEDSASYKSFLKKLKSAEAESPRVLNSLRRRMGVEVPDKRNRQRGRNVSQFVAYDGEGYGDKYVLLANSFGGRIINPEGLSSEECLEFLAEKFDIPTKRIFFAFGYDINHILHDVPDDVLEELLKNRIVEWRGFKMQYIPGKIFSVNGIKYYDTFGFFQTSFVNVVRLMLGEEFVSEGLVAGKEARGTFESWPIEKIVAYNDEELDLMVKIFERLRQAFHDVDIYLTEWYGPGAVAKYWYKQHGVYPNEHQSTQSLLALNGAYYGGRFEQITLGKIQPIYEYDIHSAYPSVMVDMPYFLEWKRTKKYEDNPYSIWHVSYDFRHDYIKSPETRNFLPLPMRSKDGHISFPLVGRGWYWQCEIAVALRHFPNARITFHEGYVGVAGDKPFGWVKELYDYRAELKRSGNLAQYAVKVGINSLYGKTAQRAGRNPFFSLAWAGYITANTRAKLVEAAYSSPASVVGFATDALFTTKRIASIPISDDLGDWEESQFDSGIFFQSGVYRLVRSGSVTDRYRGAPLRRGIDNIIEQLKEHPREYPAVRIGRFISHLLALRAPNTYGPHRLQFVQVQHRLQFDAPYKRHYIGFMERISDNGKLVSDYSRLLRQPIESTPKVWVNDNNPFEFHDYLYDQLKFQNVESSPPPMKDSLQQALVDEGLVVASAEGYAEVGDIESLPIVEDTTS